MDRIELLIRRRNVDAFIDADDVVISLTRQSELTKSAAGGTKRSAPTVLAPQQARIVLNKRRYNKGIVNSEAGDIPHTDYLLIGMPGLDIEVNDTFVWLEEHYKVTGIYGARTESFLCAIDLLGKSADGS